MARFFLIATAVLALTALVAVLAYFLGAEEEAFERAFALGFLTFITVGGIIYLIIHICAFRPVEIPKEELGESEVVWGKSSGSMVHYSSDHPLLFWHTVGGKLFLTNERVEFRPFDGQPAAYRIVIPLCEIRRARPGYILGVIPGILRIEKHDGSSEVFGFGAAFDVSREWAEAIMDFRDDLEECADTDQRM